MSLGEDERRQSRIHAWRQRDEHDIRRGMSLVRHPDGAAIAIVERELDRPNSGQIGRVFMQHEPDAIAGLRLS